jgi:hypothetical protein
MQRRALTVVCVHGRDSDEAKIRVQCACSVVVALALSVAVSPRSTRPCTWHCGRGMQRPCKRAVVQVIFLLCHVWHGVSATACGHGDSSADKRQHRRPAAHVFGPPLPLRAQQSRAAARGGRGAAQSEAGGVVRGAARGGALRARDAAARARVLWVQ